MKRKIVVTVAPVCHVGKPVPEGSKNPLTPEEIAADVVACAEAGASMVHLHVRDLTGEQTFDMTQFSRTLDLIRQKSDIVIQGSTGGLSTLSLEDRSVCLSEPRVEVASLNMGSVNFGESVYINTLPEIRYWAGRMREEKVVPEMEIFDLSMVETCTKLADEGVLDRPLSYNFCLGTGTASNLSDTPHNLSCMVSLMEKDGHWGLNNDSMKDLHFLGLAIAMGASVVRVGFEDSFYYEEGKTAPTNAFLVEKLVELVRALGCEPATPEEARHILGIDKLRN
ncbi:MAG: 3-keto-5-aminohexanoate cleavage protein [Alistipes sp.]|nr:3-keto-5-aminohexanoate cleavage protein [Alistipes sp.]MBQ5393715.1 3-keto-5-aminohexanoate cleavage protein [Alistipes sp.]